MLESIIKATPHKACAEDAPTDFFVRLYRNSAGILSYVKGFLCKMTENMYPKGTSFGRRRFSAKPSGGLCAVLPKERTKESPDIISRKKYTAFNGG